MVLVLTLWFGAPGPCPIGAGSVKPCGSLPGYLARRLIGLEFGKACLLLGSLLMMSKRGLSHLVHWWNLLPSFAVGLGFGGTLSWGWWDLVYVPCALCFVLCVLCCLLCVLCFVFCVLCCFVLLCYVLCFVLCCVVLFCVFVLCFVVFCVYCFVFCGVVEWLYYSKRIIIVRWADLSDLFFVDFRWKNVYFCFTSNENCHFSSEKRLPPQNGVVDFPRERDTFRNKIMEIV